jgi:hypothetical protein
LPGLDQSVDRARATLVKSLAGAGEGERTTCTNMAMSLRSSMGDSFY